MIFPRSPIAGYMETVPVDVMTKSAASLKTLQTHLIFSASDAAVVEFIVAVLRLQGKRKLTAHDRPFQPMLCNHDLTLPHADDPS
jgi:hypothetical protein